VLKRLVAPASGLFYALLDRLSRFTVYMSMKINRLTDPGFKYKYFCDPNPKIHNFGLNLKPNIMKVRAKFSLFATKHEDGSMSVSGGVVTSGCEENKEFAEYTPTGSFSMCISKDKPAQELFSEEGDEYIIYIEKCPKA
jgi:hypothetical protein